MSSSSSREEQPSRPRNVFRAPPFRYDPYDVNNNNNTDPEGNLLLSHPELRSGPYQVDIAPISGDFRARDDSHPNPARLRTDADPAPVRVNGGVVGETYDFAALQGKHRRTANRDSQFLQLYDPMMFFKSANAGLRQVEARAQALFNGAGLK